MLYLQSSTSPKVGGAEYEYNTQLDLLPQCEQGALQTAVRLSVLAKLHQRPLHRAVRTGSTQHCAGARSPNGSPWAVTRGAGSSA